MRILLLMLLLCTQSWGLLAQTTVHLVRENGVFVVPCKVNGLDLRFIFDTGASDVSISLTEALFMVKNGYLFSSDILNKQSYQDATGKISVGTRIILRRIEFAGIVLRDVAASVVNELDAPLLLGQSAMEQIGRFTLDPKQGLLIVEQGKPSNYSRNSTNTTNPKQGTSQYSPPSKPYDYSSIQTFTGKVEVISDSPILDKPDATGRTIGACKSNRAEIVEKVNDRYYLVDSGRIRGYLFVTWIKRQL